MASGPKSGMPGRACREGGATVAVMSIHRAAPTLERRHLRRRCVGCGLAAEAINAGSIDECPRCGCDLSARPPRSYAEMEGLFELDAAEVPEPAALARARADAAAARWLLVVGAVAVAGAGTLAGALLLAAP